MSKRLCPRCGLTLAGRQDLMVPPSPAECSLPGGEACLGRLVSSLSAEVSRLRSLNEEQASTNCGLVSQNCRLIERNTALEKVVTRTSFLLQGLSPSEEDLWEAADALAVARGESDIFPLPLREGQTVSCRDPHGPLVLGGRYAVRWASPFAKKTGEQSVALAALPGFPYVPPMSVFSARRFARVA